MRGLESAVARERGDAPVVRVTLELTPEEAADLDEAVRKLREERGVAVPVGSAVAELCRRAQGPPVDRPGFQVVIQECARCATATRDTRDGPIVVAPEEVAAAKVDAEVLDLREGGPGRRHLSIAPAERRAVIARDHGRCALCGTRSWLHIHHLERNKGDVRALSLLCSACHKGLVHAGHVAIDGHAPSLAFRLRDGTPAPVRSR